MTHCTPLPLSSSVIHLLAAVTEAFGRLFGTWTLITCMLCAICAFNIHNEAIYGAYVLGPEGEETQS